MLPLALVVVVEEIMLGEVIILEVHHLILMVEERVVVELVEGGTLMVIQVRSI